MKKVIKKSSIYKLRLKINKLLWFVPLRKLKKMKIKQLKKYREEHKCFICQKIFRFKSSQKSHIVDNHEESEEIVRRVMETKSVMVRGGGVMSRWMVARRRMVREKREGRDIMVRGGGMMGKGLEARSGMVRGRGMMGTRMETRGDMVRGGLMSGMDEKRVVRGGGLMRRMDEKSMFKEGGILRGMEALNLVRGRWTRGMEARSLIRGGRMIRGIEARRPTSPGGREASPDGPSMRASLERPGRRASPVMVTGLLETSTLRGVGPPRVRGGTPSLGTRMIRPPMQGQAGVRMRGAPGGPLVRGRMPMGLGVPSLQRGLGGTHVRGMRPRTRDMRPSVPMGRGLTGMRGAPFVRGIPKGLGVPSLQRSLGGTHGTTDMRGVSRGLHMRGMRPRMPKGGRAIMMQGTPEGSHVRGMSSRMQMGQGLTRMRGAAEGILLRPRIPMGRGSPRGPWPFIPENPLRPAVRADFPNSSPIPELKNIEVTILIDEESPPVNSALDRLKKCGISVTRQKAPPIHNGINLPSGISLSQVPSRCSVKQRHSDGRQ